MNKNPMGEAMMWVSKITSSCIAMVLPGIGGMWLDKQLGTTPVLGLVLLVFGMVAGFYLLVKMVQEPTRKQ